ncbi:MAG TPA: hypothetical protein VMT00_02640 [Thermoanaerobaculia bacterium]|nr:hypothetical protein [Thermoanaerobaculia bacterium]
MKKQSFGRHQHTADDAGETSGVAAADEGASSYEASTVADFARLNVLVNLFDGDPDRWLLYLDELCMTTEELFSDARFLYRVKILMRSRPHFLSRLRNLVRDTHSLLEDIQEPTN